MKKLLSFLFCFIAFSLSCFSQDCDGKFNSAMSLFEKEEYAKARDLFNQVIEQCGKGGDYRGALGKIKECEDALKPKFEIGKRNVSFGPQGGSETIKVTSNSSWNIGNCPEWLTLSKKNGKLDIECERNNFGFEREAKITLTSGEGSYKVSRTIVVTQIKSILNVSTKSISIPGYGGIKFLVEVTSNDDWHVAHQTDNWFTATKTDNGVLVSSSENPSSIERRGTFEIETDNFEKVTIEVKQEKGEAKLNVQSSLIVSWNAKSYKLRVDSNDPNWEANVIQGGSWCKVEKQNDHELLITMQDNDGNSTRDAVIEISIDNAYTNVTLTQRVYGYVALYEDYFTNIGSTRRLTKVSAGTYAGGTFGVRVSALMYRWKVFEIDFLNLNTSVSKTYQLSWEPMVRGYLPLQRDGRRWTAYMGIGGCISFVDVPLNGNIKRDHSNVLFEAGAECKLNFKGYDNLSARLFLRIDGYFSVGVAVDMFEWK